MIRNLCGDTVLHLASSRQASHIIRDILMFEKSLAHRPEISLLTSRNLNGRLPLYYAIRHGGIVESVKIMLEFEAQDAGLPFPPQSSDCQESKLLRSCLGLVLEEMDPNFCKWLLERYAVDANQKDGDGKTLLWHAAHSGRKMIVQLLLDKGADVNAQGGEYGTALQTTARFGSLEVVRLLLENGADVNAQGGKHGSALKVARRWSYGEERERIVALLLRYGAKEELESDIADETQEHEERRGQG